MGCVLCKFSTKEMIFEFQVVCTNQNQVPYFPTDNAHLTYNAHITFVTLCMYLCTDHLVICGQLENCTLT